MVDSMLMLGTAKSEYGQPLPSEFRQVQRIAEVLYKDAPLKMAGVKSLVGQQLANIGKPRQARIYLRDAIDAYRAIQGEDHPLVGRAAFWLGKVELSLQHKTAARDHFLTTVEHDSSSALLAHAFLVKVYEELGQPDMATKHCRAIGASRPFDPNQEQTPLYITPPEYPSRELRQGREGEVVVSYTLDADGFVTDPQVIRNKGGKGFNAAALEAVQKWRFAPRYAAGQAVATQDLRHRITFELE